MIPVQNDSDLVWKLKKVWNTVNVSESSSSTGSEYLESAITDRLGLGPYLAMVMR